MEDIHIRKSGHAGRITFTRPKALNAMSYDMCIAIENALDAWREDASVALIVIDAEGDKAFCAGGDIAELYETGKAGNFAFGQTFWADEYRMNAKMADYPKPVASFMQGFTMGGGVGVGCHCSHRVVGDSSQIAMPECGIGLVPDVGGSLILANAPGALGKYLGLTTARLGAGDAIHAGFADHYIPQEKWTDLIATLEESGDVSLLDAAAQTAPEAPLAENAAEIDTLFAADTLEGIVAALEGSDSAFAAKALKSLSRNSPISLGVTIEMLKRLKGSTDIRAALDLEYRFTYRAMEHGDFIEGIRAQIIDKDRNPKWQHEMHSLPHEAVDFMLAPLGAAALTFKKGD